MNLRSGCIELSQVSHFSLLILFYPYAPKRPNRPRVTPQPGAPFWRERRPDP